MNDHDQHLSTLRTAGAHTQLAALAPERARVDALAERAARLSQRVSETREELIRASSPAAVRARREQREQERIDALEHGHAVPPPRVDLARQLESNLQILAHTAHEARAAHTAAAASLAAREQAIVGAPLHADARARALDLLDQLVPLLPTLLGTAEHYDGAGPRIGIAGGGARWSVTIEGIDAGPALDLGQLVEALRGDRLVRVSAGPDDDDDDDEHELLPASP